MSKDLVKNLEVFDDTELALVVALRNMVGQLGQPFRRAADGVLDRLFDCVTSMPVFVKIDDAVPLDSALLNRIVRAVHEKTISVWVSDGLKTHVSKLQVSVPQIDAGTGVMLVITELGS